MNVALIVTSLALAAVSPEDRIALRSPGLAPSHVDAKGHLIEDWGTLSLRLAGEDLGEAGAVGVSAAELDGVIPAARIAWRHGPVSATVVAFRAPVWPAGLDVLTVRLEGTGEAEVRGRLVVSLTEGARTAAQTVSLGSRRILTLPDRARVIQEPRPWGYFDEAAPLPGWATPIEGHDPSFANIRAGMGGVPILYRFAIEPKSERGVVLGFCESYWTSAGSRLMTCKVEGAPSELVDPLARWGRHRPGGLLFEGSDADGDGWLEVLVLPGPDTPDRNPILNAVWVFEPDAKPDLAQVISGRLNVLATHHVDVGGERDQSLIPGGDLEFAFALAPGGTEELTFLVACPGGSAPIPDETAWTPARLREAARDVWESWE